jgi:hypothetical protein
LRSTQRIGVFCPAREGVLAGDLDAAQELPFPPIP